MDITVRDGDNFRIQTPQAGHFIDVGGCGAQGLRVMAYPNFHYIEVREKAGKIATFYFKSKRHKKEADLGWWTDGEVVYAKNEVCL